MSKVDILYLAHGRDEFTAASLASIGHDRTLLNGGEMIAYTDGLEPSDELFLGLQDADYINKLPYGGPVAIMRHFLSLCTSDILVKLDNDVICPPGWLDAALSIMSACPELDILGLEPPASRTPNPNSGQREYRPEDQLIDGPGYACVDCVGGIFVARRRAFEGRPLPDPHGFRGVGGFTSWQLSHPEVVKGWIVPPLKLFLLDRLPFPPWSNLSARYISEGLQRPWTNYDPANAEHLWEWWL